MTPDGLPASGSPVCAGAAQGSPSAATSAATSAAIPTVCRAARIRDNVGITAVAEDISPPAAARDGSAGAPGGGPRAVVAVAPVAVALILLSIAVLSDGAF